ncbi:MAG: sugar phosphate isomerase/epimerase family protein [Limisphaerales bacterium]
MTATKDRQFAERLAVCSWSLQPANPRDLAAKLQTTGVKRIQLALDPLRDCPDVWGDTAAVCREQGIGIISGMFGCVGEDYTTLESIQRTGGIAPDATWAENLKNIKLSAKLAQDLGLKLVAFHAGFLPHDESDPRFAKMLERLRTVADVFQERNMVLGLETGQEAASVLLGLLRKLDRPNLGVNFDPANMILYDKGNPIEALRLLGPWVRQVHVKDARKTLTPGTWGEEVPVGTGQVAWPEFFAALREINFAGYCVIEREAGTQRAEDIRTAKAAVEKASRSHTRRKL